MDPRILPCLCHEKNRLRIDCILRQMGNDLTNLASVYEHVRHNVSDFKQALIFKEAQLNRSRQRNIHWNFDFPHVVFYGLDV